MDEYTDSDATQSDTEELELIYDEEDVSEEDDDDETPNDENDTRTHFKAWLLRKGLLPHMASDDNVRPSHLHDAVVDTYLRERAAAWITEAHTNTQEPTSDTQEEGQNSQTIPALLTYQIVNGWLGSIVDFARSLRLPELELAYPICKAFVNEHPRLAGDNSSERPFGTELGLDPDLFEDQILDSSANIRHAISNLSSTTTTGNGVAGAQRDSQSDSHAGGDRRSHGNGSEGEEGEESEEDADDRELRSEHDRRVHGRMMHRLYRHAKDVRHTWIYSMAFKISSKAENLRGLRWGDLCFKSYDIGTASRQQNLDCLGVLYNQGKLNADGKQEYAGCFRDQNVLICSWAALSLVFFQRFVMESPDGVDLTDESWLDELLVPNTSQDDVVDYTSPITPEEHGRIIRENAKGIGDTVPADYENIDYMYRDAVKPTVGEWDKDVLREHYVTLPTDTMSNCAGWPEGHLHEIFLPRYDRSKVDMPVTLRIKFHNMFSFADTYIALQECAARVDVRTLSFARLCQRMRETLPEDAPALWKAYPNLSIWKHEPFSSSDWREWVTTQARNCKRSHDRYLRDTLHIRPEMDEMRALQRSTEHLFVRALDRMEGSYTQRLNDTLRETTSAFRGEISELRAALRRLGQSSGVGGSGLSSPTHRGEDSSNHMQAYNAHTRGYAPSNGYDHTSQQGGGGHHNRDNMSHQQNGAWVFGAAERQNHQGVGVPTNTSTTTTLNFNQPNSNNNSHGNDTTNNLGLYTSIGSDPLDFGIGSTNTTNVATNSATTDEFGLNLNTNIRVQRRATVDAGTQTMDIDASADETAIENDTHTTQTHADTDAPTNTHTHKNTQLQTQTETQHDTHAHVYDNEAEPWPSGGEASYEEYGDYNPETVEYIPPAFSDTPEYSTELNGTPLPAPSSMMLQPPLDPHLMTTLSEPIGYGDDGNISNASPDVTWNDLEAIDRDIDGDSDANSYRTNYETRVHEHSARSGEEEGDPEDAEVADLGARFQDGTHTRRSKRRDGTKVNGDVTVNGHTTVRKTKKPGGGLALGPPGTVVNGSKHGKKDIGRNGSSILSVIHATKRRWRDTSHADAAKRKPTANARKKRRSEQRRNGEDLSIRELEEELELEGLVEFSASPTPAKKSKTHKRKKQRDNLLVENLKADFPAILRYVPTMEAQLGDHHDEMTEKNVKRYSRYKGVYDFVLATAPVHYAWAHETSVEVAETLMATGEEDVDAVQELLARYLAVMVNTRMGGIRQTALIIMDRILQCAEIEDAETRYEFVTGHPRPER